MEAEKWVNIKGYEGKYLISSNGKVYSTPNKRLMKPTDNGNGYLIVGLRKNGHRQNHYIHRLVAEHFIGGHGEVVNHIDYNRKNNEAKNLEWCSQSENVRHSRTRFRIQHKGKAGRTGVRYLTSRGEMFRVCIPKAKVDRSFRSFEDAMKYRNEVLDGLNYIY